MVMPPLLNDPRAGLSNPAVDPRAQVTTTNTNLLNAPLIEFIQEQALQQYDQGGPRYFGGSTVADFGPATRTAIQGAIDQYNQGPANLQGVNNLLGSTMQGDMLGNDPATQNLAGLAAGNLIGNNPYTDRVADRVQHQIGNQVAAQFGASGRTGSGAHAGALARGIGDAVAPIYQQGFENDQNRQLTANSLLSANFNAERGRQLQAASLLPQVDQLRFSGLQQLAGAGSAQDNLLQRQLSDQVNRFNFDENRGINALSRLAGIAGNPIAGSQQVAIPPLSGGSTASNALSNAFSGAAVGNLLFGGGLGTIGGGLLGGLSSFF